MIKKQPSEIAEKIKEVLFLTEKWEIPLDIQAVILKGASEVVTQMFNMEYQIAAIKILTEKMLKPK